jgi:hypothetical protein
LKESVRPHQLGASRGSLSQLQLATCLLHNRACGRAIFF